MIQGMTAAEEEEKKVIFGIADATDGSKVLLLGISRAAWNNMQNGKCSDLDLASVGIPVKLLVFGAKDKAAVMKIIKGAIPIVDEGQPLKDFSIKYEVPIDEQMTISSANPGALKEP